MKSRLLQLLAILSSAVYLVPTGAHLFELQNKLSLSQADYMVVQQIYTGWSRFGVVIVVALLASLAHALSARAERAAFGLSIAASVCLAAALANFLLFTLPVNIASKNWTVAPEPFETARRQWEYSHALSAVLTFAALAAITVSALMRAAASGRNAPTA